MISFKGRHFEKGLVLLAVRRSVAYALSYRDIEELMAERGINVDHSTINRWANTLYKEVCPASWIRVLKTAQEKG